MIVIAKDKLRVSAEWVTHTNWSPFSTTLFDLESSFGKDIHDSLHPTRRFEYPWVYSILEPFEPSDIVLDAGPGNTVLQFLISQQVKEMHSLDNYPDYVKWVSSVCKEKHFNLFPVCGDILDPPYPNSYFDKVVCISVLEHLQKGKVELALDRLIGLVKPNGKLALTMDIMLNPNDEQMDLAEFCKIADGRFVVPSMVDDVMAFSVEPSAPLFSVICLLIEEEKE